MNESKQNFDFTQLDDIAGGDENFKKELIDIFKGQIPDFIVNMNKYLLHNEMENLAREAHTAKSSVLIFGMKNTGSLLKQIQSLAENDGASSIPLLLEEVETDLTFALNKL